MRALWRGRAEGSIKRVIKRTQTQDFCDLHLKHHPHRLLQRGLTTEHADEVFLVFPLVD